MLSLGRATAAGAPALADRAQLVTRRILSSVSLRARRHVRTKAEVGNCWGISREGATFTLFAREVAEVAPADGDLCPIRAVADSRLSQSGPLSIVWLSGTPACVRDEIKIKFTKYGEQLITGSLKDL